MNRQPVISDNLSEVGWENGIMEIEFHEGSVYRYYDVPESVYDGLVNSTSVGEYFDLFIKKSLYRYEKIW